MAVLLRWQGKDFSNMFVFAFRNQLGKIINENSVLKAMLS